jgi:Phage integrase family
MVVDSRRRNVRVPQPFLHLGNVDDTIKSKRDRAILSTLLFHALRREELCKLKVRDFRHARKGVPHLKVSGKGGKTRYLPLHPGTHALIHDYLDAAGHGTDENGALFRAIRNNRTGRLERAITGDGIYKLVRAYSALLGFEIGAHALRATAATNALDHQAGRRIEQLARLMIAKGGRLAFAAFRLRAFDPFDGVMGDGVPFAKIFEQRGERREPMPDRAAAKCAPHEIIAPGDDVRACHGAEFLRPGNADEAHKILHRVFVGAARVRVGDVGKPLDLGRHIGELVKLGGGQQPFGGGDFSGKLRHLVQRW